MNKKCVSFLCLSLVFSFLSMPSLSQVSFNTPCFAPEEGGCDVPDDIGPIGNPGGGNNGGGGSTSTQDYGNNGDVGSPILGSADLHSHLMAEHMFGGGYFWGNVDGPKEWALRRCNGGSPLESKDHATIGPNRGLINLATLGIPGAILSEFLGQDTGVHLGKRRGYDRRQCKKFLGITIPGTCPREHFEHWPAHDAKSHQQMWHGHLREAHDKGLQFMVVSLTESNFLCEAMPPRLTINSCDEMESVFFQATQLRELVSNHQNWIGIAHSPRQARQIIAEGKLAIMIAVEVTNLFPNGNVSQALQRLMGIGVRSMQIVHHANNKFAGVAPLPQLIKAAKATETLFGGGRTNIDDVECKPLSECNASTSTNPVRLKREGRSLISNMVDTGMLLDVAHVSRRTFYDIHGHLGQIADHHYPIFASHNEMWEAMHPDSARNEKYLTSSEINMITQTRGMVGLRTSKERAINYNPAVRIETVSNPKKTSASIRHFAQALMYAVDSGLDVGFGADLNGFIEQTGPDVIRNSARNRSELSKKGLAHIGLLPDFIPELAVVGTPQRYGDHLNQSAENFIAMWERAWRLRNNPVRFSENFLRSEQEEWIHYRVAVPPSSKKLSVSAYGSNGNADVYIRRFHAPTLNDYSARSIRSGNSSELINFDLPSRTSTRAETWFVSVRATETFDNLTINVTVN